MFFNRCAVCGCPLDPGEGRVCDECIIARERKRAQEEFAEILMEACVDGNFAQMEMEDFLNEERNYKNAF